MAGVSFVPLPGSGRQSLPSIEQVGSPDESARIEVTVVTRRRAELPPGSVTGAMLSGDELAQLYGTDPADAKYVRDTLSRFGLEVTQIDPGWRRLKVAGTVAALCEAFGTSLSIVRSAHPSGTGVTEHRYRLGPLHVPAELEGIVVAVLGLDNRPQTRPHVRLAPVAADSRVFTPNHVAQIYRFPASMAGAGQTIAFIELGGGFSASDLQTYFSGLGIPVPVVTAVSVDGMANAPGTDPWAARQVLLDIEVAGAVSPGATQVVYFAPNTDQGIVDAVIDAVHASPTPTALCISWGQSESAWTKQALTALNLAIQDGAALGVTVCVAAGDDGSSDGQADGQNHVVFPASSPHCLACGGTSLRTDPATGIIISETVWNDGPGGGAGGGGISDEFILPEWQASVVPSISDHAGRGVPDVAGNADPATGYVLHIDGQSVVGGGTGAVASLWAALICRLAEANGQSLGSIQQALYAGASAGTTAPGFRDITSGSNGAYSAGPGWDACTGLGVCEGEDLLSRLTRSTSLEAGYDSDDIGSIDWLGITGDVNTLAALIASSHTLPPLSVGLFGDWGTGKSFFMRRLEDRVTILANAARAAASGTPPRPSFYCRYVAQITFNAWHYVEADLWASLATRIFEGLNNYLQVMYPGEASGKAYRDLISQLESSRAALADAEKRLAVAKVTLCTAQARLESQRHDRDSRTLAELAERQPELHTDVKRLSSALGLEENKAPVSEVQKVSTDLRQTRGHLRRSWQALAHYLHGQARRKLLLIFAAFVVAAALLLAWFLARDKPLAATVASAVTLLSGVITTLTLLLAGTQRVLTAADMVVQAKDRQEQDSINASEREIEQAQERVRLLEEEVARVQQLEFPTLDSFIQARATSSDYRKHLGLVALIQRDFQALSDLLTASSRRRAAGGVSKGQPPPVDRVVLYIDDLDRCPPNKVVQVLQAVHLLLAFPLFVVVVGVDSRWLVRSLEHEYDAILSPDKPTENRPGQEGELASTPHNYLEKIFQIPFWLRPMAPDGYGRLIRALASGSVHIGIDAQDTQAETETNAPTDGPSGSTPVQDEPQVRSAGLPTVASPAPSSAPVDLTPSALIITDDELAYAEKLSLLIPTPRAAKRFINLYRLLKVGLSDKETINLSGGDSIPGEYQAALLLLAVMVGAPAEADTIFRSIRGHSLNSWTAVIDELRPQPRDDSGATEYYSRAAGQLSASGTARWNRLCQILDEIGAPATANGLAPFRSWADRIGRYSFTAGSSANVYGQPTDKTKSPRRRSGPKPSG